MTKAEITRRLQQIETRGFKGLDVDWTMGRARIFIASNGRYISPRMTKAQTMFWLDAFEEGCAFKAYQEV